MVPNYIVVYYASGSRIQHKTVSLLTLKIKENAVGVNKTEKNAQIQTPPSYTRTEYEHDIEVTQSVSTCIFFQANSPFIWTIGQSDSVRTSAEWICNGVALYKVVVTPTLNVSSRHGSVSG